MTTSVPSIAGIDGDCGVFVDVDRDLDGSIPSGIVADVLLDRVRTERARFVVLNFHDRRTVPSECLRLISAIGASSTPIPIVVTEAGEDVRLSLVGTGHLAPTALGETSSSTVISRGEGQPVVRVPSPRSMVISRNVDPASADRTAER
jgi:hypothetical protein